MRTLAACALLLAAAPAAAQCPLEPLDSPDPDTDDLYGWDVDVDGKTAVVGAFLDDEAADQGGAAYVLEFDGARWRTTQKLGAPDPEYGDWFGRAVAIDGDTLVASAPGKQVGNLNDAGTVYVFRRSAGGGPWAFETRLDPSGLEAGDRLGYTSIDIDGARVLVGAWRHGPFSKERGVAYIFRRAPLGWQQWAKLVSPDGDNSYRFGWAVDLERDRAAITQPGPGYEGAVHLFRDVAGQWVHEIELKSAVSAPFQTLGRCVDLDGDTLVAGAPFDATHVDTGGSAVIFREGTNGWFEEQRLYPPVSDDRAYYGWRVGVEEDRLVVGAWRESLTNPNQGAAYLYHRRDGTWELVNRFEDPDGEAGDEFTGNLDVDGPHLLIGAAYHASAGRVNAYLLSAPLPYCQAKVNSLGCLPTIHASGVPSLTSTQPFVVSATGVLSHQFGVMAVGDGASAEPFHGGTLCVHPVRTRIGAQISGGSSSGVDCSGTLRCDVNAVLQGGLVPPVEVGEELFLQWWYRDPWDATGVGMSDALRFRVCP